MKPRRNPPRPQRGYAQRPARDPLGAAQCRGLIVLLLADEFPDSRLEDNIRKEVEAVTGVQEDRVWRSHLAYLEQQGFITQELRTLRGHELVTWAVSPLGLNLCDGVIEADPGVALGGEG